MRDRIITVLVWISMPALLMLSDGCCRSLLDIYGEVPESHVVRELRLLMPQRSVAYIRAGVRVKTSTWGATLWGGDFCYWSASSATVQKVETIAGASYLAAFPSFELNNGTGLFFFQSLVKEDLEVHTERPRFVDLSPSVICFDTTSNTGWVVARGTSARLGMPMMGLSTSGSFLPLILHGQVLPECRLSKFVDSRFCADLLGIDFGALFRNAERGPGGDVLCLFSPETGTVDHYIEYNGYVVAFLGRADDPPLAAMYPVARIPCRWPMEASKRAISFCLLEGDEVLVSNIRAFLGATHDLRFLFYAKRERGEPESVLWVYDVRSRKPIAIGAWKVGSCLRTHQDGTTFGFLIIERSEQHIEIQGCRIFDTQGVALFEAKLPEPVKADALDGGLVMGPHPYDWDLDSMTLAYYDGQLGKIVVKDFEGQVIWAFSP